MNTLFDKIWDAHVVTTVEDGPTQLYIDRLYCHEVTSPQAFAGLRERGIGVLRPEKVFCMPDHNTPTHDQDREIEDPISKTQVDTLLGRAYRAWDGAQFETYLDRFGIDRRKAIKDYSRGMKMKLSIAAALSHGAELLILDEATSGLDPVVRDEVLDLLYDFMQDETHAVLLSSHITSDLDKIADNITFIHHGRVLLSEGRDELIDRHGVLRCTEEQLNALDPDAVRAVRKGAFGCEALVKRDGIPENWPVEPVSVEQIMLFLTRGEEA